MDVRWTKTASTPAGRALQQSLWYARAAEHLGADVFRAEIRTVEARGTALVICRRFGPGPRIALIPRGPAWEGRAPDSGQRRAALAALRRSLPGSSLCLLATPEDPTPGILPLVTQTHLAEWALTDDIDALRASLHGKWRNRLVRAESTGAMPTLTVPNVQDLQRLAIRDQDQGRRKGYRGAPLGFLEAWRAVGGEMRLARLEEAGTTLAEMLFLMHAPGATYQIGWTSDAGRAISAHHLLLWQAAKQFAGAGVHRLDLGTLDTRNSAGLARFKLGTGAVHRAVGPTGLVWAR